MDKTWKLIGSDGKPFVSVQPGTLGGHRRLRIYGRLDCPSARGHIARGNYVAHRVFFLSDEHARAAGYRPCGICMRDAYQRWNAEQQHDS